MSRTTTEAAKQVHRERARLAGRTNRSLPGDPAIAQARADLAAAQQRAAASAALDAVTLRLAGEPPEKWIPALRVAGVPTGVVLLEAIEMLTYLARLSDRPDELIAALRTESTRA